jgi:hypothetical protein
MIACATRYRKDAKKRWVLPTILAILLGLSAAPVFASNDNHAYSFTIQPHYANSYSSAAYRQTTNLSNQWKVDLAYSGEGAGTITTFWLAKSVGRSVGSNTHDVRQGSGAHYYVATNSVVSATDVVLGGENNNDSANSYIISGYWDEETN